MKDLISPKVSNASVEPPNKVVTLASIAPSANIALDFSVETALDNSTSVAYSSPNPSIASDKAPSANIALDFSVETAVDNWASVA